MGAVFFSIPKNLVVRVQQKLGINNFVETGTYKGGTSFWAASLFKNVYTIEINEQISKATASNPACPKNVNFFVGTSRLVLPELAKKIEGQSFFWLDGHWMGEGVIDANDECPIIEEIISLATCKDPIIFVDDARLFLGAIPPPLTPENWPSIDVIFETFRTHFPNSYTTIVDDVIICVPKSVKPIIDEYWLDTYNERFATKNSLATKIVNRIKKIFYAQ